MATKYNLTWRAEQGGRWRKKYKGRSYYFKRNPGETKEASYKRCWAEWAAKKEAIDRGETEAEPWHRGLTNLIVRTKGRLAELQLEDTPENRKAWIHYNHQLGVYEDWLKNGVNPFLDGDDIDNPPDYIGGGIEDGDAPNVPPPWAAASVSIPPIETLGGNVQRFLDRKAAQAKRGERSVGRVDVLRVGLESFVAMVGADRPMEAVTTAALSRFRDELESLIDAGKLRPHSARDRLQAVKQFVRWAWEEELVALPRILQSREFTIALPERKIETFTDDEVKRILDASSDSTRLYILLMLNCGMTQGDVADLLQKEVDWNSGRVTRKRSKTRKNENVPEVSYPLWPATFDLLKAHRSEHPTLALTNRKGEPLKVETLVNGKVKKIDNVRSAYNRVITKLAEDKADPIVIDKPLKLFRKTAATKLGNHPEFGRFGQHFLGQAPATVADKFYIVPSRQQFDEAVTWLGGQF